MVGLVVVVAWSVWPERHKDLTLRLKFVRSEVVDGKPKLLFKVEGAEQYEVFINGFWYVHGDDHSTPLIPNISLLPDYLLKRRQFYADPPRYSPYYPPSTPNDQTWKMRCNAQVLVDDRKLSKLWWVAKNTWTLRQESHNSIVYVAKYLWRNSPRRNISEQTITSELITSDLTTNTPPH